MPPRSDIVVRKFILVPEAEKLLMELPKNYSCECNLYFLPRLLHVESVMEKVPQTFLNWF